MRRWIQILHEQNRCLHHANQSVRATLVSTNIIEVPTDDEVANTSKYMNTFQWCMVADLRQ
jgi:hypothetical protein